jgi:hypothetical protein
MDLFTANPAAPQNVLLAMQMTMKIVKINEKVQTHVCRVVLIAVNFLIPTFTHFGRCWSVLVLMRSSATVLTTTFWPLMHLLIIVDVLCPIIKSLNRGPAGKAPAEVGDCYQSTDSEDNHPIMTLWIRFRTLCLRQ